MAGQDLLDQMDEALENDDAILQKQRERGAEMRAAKACSPFSVVVLFV